MKFFVAPDGVDAAETRAGETSENPIIYTELFEPGFLRDDQQFQFLPGTYYFPETLDLSPYVDMVVYGDGKVIVDGLGLLFPAIKLGTRSTVAGIRFRDCGTPVELVDGAQETLVGNCFDYHFENIPAGGQSFTAKVATNCAFRNLTSRRDGIGISVLKGVVMQNCLSLGLSDIARPGYVGEILDLFGNTDDWVGVTSGAAYVTQMQPSGFYEGSELLMLIVSNATGSPGFIRVQRNLALTGALDMSRGDRAVLLYNLLDVQGEVAGADTYRFFFESPAGTARFDVANTSLSLGLNVLEFDLTAPTAVTGSLDLSQVTTVAVETNLGINGVVQHGLDHLYLKDSSLIMDFNVSELVDTADPNAAFRGTNGILVDDFPPPFESPSIERLQYSDTLPHFGTYVAGGYRAFPFGAIYNGCHTFLDAEPGHLRFNNHVALGAWTNDENFYDTTLDQVGPEGEGFSLVLDENLATIGPLNGETINFADTNVIGEVRDLDDAKGHKFDKSSGVLEETGATYTFGPAIDLTAGGAIALAGEYKIPVGALTDVKTEGLEIVAYSAGGQVSQTLAKVSLLDGWNEVILEWANPEASSGTFDPTSVIQIDLKLHVNAGASIVGNVIDHLSRPVTLGPSTAPVDLGTGGSLGINLNSYPEGRVARAISDPFLCRNVGAFIRAVWAALENADGGAYINRAAYQQSLTTRTIEIRFSELKFGKYGSLVGLLAKDWTPISRLGKVPSPGSKFWVSLRLTLRNRTNVPVS